MNMDDISLYMLKCFITVADLKNITSAAEKLYLSQPSLSRKLSKLEDELGKKLFRRTPKGIELTPDGLQFYEQSQKIVTALTNLQELSNPKENIRGTLSVGYQRPTFDFLTEFNAKFFEAYPNVNIKTVRLRQQNVVNELLYGNLDMSIIYEHELKNYQKVINQLPIGSCIMRLLISRKHPLAQRDKIHLAELKDEKFIVLDRNIAPVKIDEFYQHCNNNGFVPNVIRVEKEHLDIVADILTFNAVSLAPTSPRQHTLDVPVDDGIKYVDLDGFDTDYPVCLAWPVTTANPLVPFYADFVKELTTS